jgi:hypothetical protein
MPGRVSSLRFAPLQPKTLPPCAKTQSVRRDSSALNLPPGAGWTARLSSTAAFGVEYVLLKGIVWTSEMLARVPDHLILYM